MNAEKYLKDKNHTIEAIQCYDQNLTNGSMNIIELMEGYYQTKLKLLGIGGVIECLQQVNTTLERHGKVEANTDLHNKIRNTL